MVGLSISRLSGFAARCGGRDLAARRVIDQAVYDLRLEISQAAPSWRISAASHWMTTVTDVEMTHDEVRRQVERADCFIEQLRDAIPATVVDPASSAPTLNVEGFGGSLRHWTRCRT